MPECCAICTLVVLLMLLELAVAVAVLVRVRVGEAARADEVDSDEAVVAEAAHADKLTLRNDNTWNQPL